MVKKLYVLFRANHSSRRKPQGGTIISNLRRERQRNQKAGLSESTSSKRGKNVLKLISDRVSLM